MFLPNLSIEPSIFHRMKLRKYDFGIVFVHDDDEKNDDDLKKEMVFSSYDIVDLFADRDEKTCCCCCCCYDGNVESAYVDIRAVFDVVEVLVFD